MTAFGRATRYCVEDFQWRHQFTGTKNLDGQATTGHLGDFLCEANTVYPNAGNLFGPGHGHFPGDDFLSLDDTWTCEPNGSPRCQSGEHRTAINRS